jgi:hypothetical protein
MFHDRKRRAAFSAAGATGAAHISPPPDNDMGLTASGPAG